MTAPALHAPRFSEEPMPLAGLDIVRRLLTAFHQGGVLYCHWKSNEHLQAGLLGDTDLDILVLRDHSSKAECVLIELGYKRFATPPLRTYPAISDFLGFDEATGRLVHIHLHYELTIGEAHLKSYHLPWERHLLDARKLDDTSGVYTADPAHELVLLIVRAALKRRWRDRLKPLVGRRELSTDVSREFAWLVAHTDSTHIRHAFTLLLGRQVIPLLPDTPQELCKPSRFRVLARYIRDAARQYRSFGRPSAALHAWRREAQWCFDAANRRYLHLPIPLRRTSPRGGLVIALLGSDGAGKSTLQADLIKWLGWKLDILPIYFGSGGGTASFYRWPLLKLHRLVQRGGREAFLAGADTESAARHPGRSRVREAARFCWAITLALEKRSKLRKMTRARNRGMIVVCDRFPQSTVADFNDGPLLQKYRSRRSRLLRRISEWEASVYHRAKDVPPDLVIKLIAAADVAFRRRPDMSIESLQKRIDTVVALRFSAPTAIIEADAPAGEVALAARKVIWPLL